MNDNLYEELLGRGVIKDSSSEFLSDKLNQDKLNFYIGTDPTADSLHLGHYSSLITAKRLAMNGHKAFILIGGATGLIGDPRGTAEREKVQKNIIKKNSESLEKQIKKIFSFEVINNIEWTEDVNSLEFLKDVGKHINVSYMINKDLVKRQLESGISFAEFSYMLLQAYDFKYLTEKYNINLQIAGSDQWGNITTGIELVRKTLGKEVFGFTMPLVVDSNGKKFGKSEGNAIWLDINKTSSEELFNYLMSSSEVDVFQYLKRLTFLSLEEISIIKKLHAEYPEKKIAQSRLGYEVVKDIHGKEEADKYLKVRH